MALDPELHQQWFRGRVALVTGAGSGIGYEIALALGRAGSRVGVHYRSSADKAQALVDQIRSAGGEAVALQADLSRAQQVEKLFGDLDCAFGGQIDMLVNNAGDWMDKFLIIECSIEQWDKMFDVNAKSIFLCCQQAARRMVKQRSGSILNMGSIAGHTGGGGGTVPYAAAKGAVHTFTRGLAKELALNSIRVNAVAPGFVETPMIEGRVSPEATKAFCATIPLGRISQASEVVPLAMLLLSPESAYLTGQIIDINGGMLMR